jgi:LysR family transcriptional regulator, benzoate and cis,cis-muconate-responsive activator of ben and cat genes
MSINRATIQEIEGFLAVAEELSFSRAARRLHISQPPLSRHIQSLEEKLGTPLFQRSTRSVSLTAAGMLYQSDVRDLLTRLDGASEAARRAASGESTRLRLAFVGGLLDESLVQVLRKFRRLHPHCQLQLTDFAPGEQLDALTAGTIDGGFIGAPPQKADRHLQTIIWKREPLLLALPENHPLASQKSIRLSRLKDDGWVMVSREAAPAFRQQFDHLCATARLKPRIVQESSRVAAVLTMVAAEQGISLLPQSLSHWIEKSVAFRPLADFKAALEHTFAYQKKQSSKALSDFVSLLRE